MNKLEDIIFNDSPESASIQTVTGWVSRDGKFFGNDEKLARYNGCTHIKCQICGEVFKKQGYCKTCSAKRRIEQFNAMKQEKWDGKSLIYSRSLDVYFYNLEEIQDRCDDDGVTLQDMQLVICEPINLREIDPYEYYCDDIDEDSEVPAEIAKAFEVLNGKIAEYGKCVSWFPSKYRLDLSCFEDKKK